MQKEIYNYAKIEAHLEAQKAKEQEKKPREQTQSFASRSSNLLLKSMTSKERTGDPFKDFALEMSYI